MALISPGAGAAERVWPENSVGEFSAFVATLRFRIYADHCSTNVPRLKAAFDDLAGSLERRVQRVSTDLLASEEFKAIKDKPVPAEIIHAFSDSFDDMKHNFERKDASVVCPKALQELGEVNEESLKSALTEILTAIRKMIGNLQGEDARRVRP